MDKFEFKTSEHNQGVRRMPQNQNEEKKDDTNEIAVRKIARNAVICFALLVCLMAVKTFGGQTETLPDKQVSSSELAGDEDLGKLKFVSESVDYSAPIDGGEVVSAFSQTGTATDISAQPKAKVKAVLTGTAVETGDDYLKMENANGTVTEYRGLRPSVHAGEKVNCAQVVGYLSAEKLTLTTVGQTGYIDTMDKDSLATASMSCEDDV